MNKILKISIVMLLTAFVLHCAKKKEEGINPLGLLVFLSGGSGGATPTITSFAPTEGTEGNTVILTGTNFSATAASNTVKFNGKTATVSTASTTSLTVTVPIGATTGNITVATGSTATSSTPFIVYQYTVTTIAGSAGTSGTATSSTGTSARFNYPYGIIASPTYAVSYVADSSNNHIKSVSTTGGSVTVYAGSAAGTQGNTDNTGTLARFYGPSGITLDSSENIYVADNLSHTIRKITNAQVVTTIAGSAGLTGTSDGTGTAAKFNGPLGITVDSSGNLFVVDAVNHTIRKITSAGVVTTFAGAAGVTGTTDGTGTAARFWNPKGITIDSSGNLYVTDNASSIRKITSAGVVTTLAGGSASGYADGTGTAAKFYGPTGITVDSKGNLYVTDTFNNNIRKITSAGVVTTIAGSTSGTAGSTNATNTAARFDNPSGITIDSLGALYVTDYNNHTIRKIVP